MPNFQVCDDFFSTEQNHPEFSFQMKDQSGGTKGPNKKGLFSSRKTGRLLDFKVFSLVSGPMILSKITPTNLLLFFNDDVQELMTKSPHDDKELVDLVDDFRSSSSIRGMSMPNFSIRYEACFSTERNHPIIVISKEKSNQLRRTNDPKKISFPSWQKDYLLDLRSLPDH